VESLEQIKARAEAAVPGAEIDIVPAASPPLIPTGQQSSLLTHIAAFRSTSFRNLGRVCKVIS
jgi:hypothetical protein